MLNSNRRTLLGFVALSLVVSPFAFAEEHEHGHEHEHEDRDRWHREHEERRDHSWREDEREQRHARAEAELRERPEAFHRERRWVGPGYYYDGRSYVYFEQPPPAYFWGEVTVEPPRPSIDIVVPIRIR